MKAGCTGSPIRGRDRLDHENPDSILELLSARAQSPSARAVRVSAEGHS